MSIFVGREEPGWVHSELAKAYKETNDVYSIVVSCLEANRLRGLCSRRARYHLSAVYVLSKSRSLTTMDPSLPWRKLRSREGEERACPKARDLNLGHQSPSPQTGTTPGCLYGKVRQGEATKHRGKCWNTLQSCTFSPAGAVEAACPAPVTAHRGEGLVRPGGEMLYWNIR